MWSKTPTRQFIVQVVKYLYMKQLHPKAVWLFFASFLFQGLFYAFLVTIWSLSVLPSIFMEEGYFQLNIFLLWMVVVVVVFSVLAFVWAKLSYHFYRFEISELGFKKESGVIWKKYVTVPYSRIQNVDINRGILARLLGLSDLFIQTAGNSATVSRVGVFGAGAEGRLPGISKIEAEALRDELVRLASRKQDQGL